MSEPVPPVRLERLRPDDWPRWRETRLAALRDAPTSFGSSYERESHRAGEEWRAWLALERGLTVLAVDDDGRPLGLVGGYRPADLPDVVELYSMWVDPSARGRGIGDALVREVVAWAREVGADEVLLWVTRTNHVAHALYERHGFHDTGREKPLPSHPCESETAMRLPIDHRPAGR
jgi:ribosomal protein S18 acetylase RimI-like enzyme